VATNSSEQPGLKPLSGSESTRCPSTSSLPPDTVAGPPAPPDHANAWNWLVGGAVSNSARSGAASVTSPPCDSVTIVLATVPSAKSAAALSRLQGAAGVVRLAGAICGAGEVAELALASAETTR